VLILIVLLLLLGVILAVVLIAWSAWFQAYIYTEPGTGFVWRGPAAAAANLAVIAIWVALDYQSGGKYRPIWETSSTEETKRFTELRVPGPANREDVYRLRPGTRDDYRLNGLPSGQRMPSTPEKIIAVDGDQRYTFEPERDDKGNFKRGKNKASAEPLRYRDEKGRVMLETTLGTLETFRGGLFFANLLVNLLLLGAAFLALWLILRFQWLHALGQAVVLCLVLMLFVLPPLLSRAESVAKERAAARAAPAS
jgi:hypothetical protein